MKICHITSVHNEEDVRIFWKECMSLAKRNDVYLVERGKSYEKNGVHIVGIGNPPKSRLKRIFLFSRRAYKKALEIDADIYHLHDPELLLYALRLVHKGKKVIFDSHEFYVEQIKSKGYLPGIIANLISKVYLVFQKFVFSKIDAVIIPCTLEGNNPFSKYSKRVEIIRNSVRIEEFSDIPVCGKTKNDDVFLACYIGGLTEERGITNIIKACYLAKVKLILAGNYSTTEYKKEVETLPEYSCVEYLGYLDRNGIKDVLKKSDVGLFVLKNVGQYCKVDAFGVKVYEYMINALPVIMSNSNYNERMNDLYDFGICVDPENIDEIAKAISFLREDRLLCKKKGNNGHNTIINDLNWSVEEKKLYLLYDTVYYNV